MAQLSEKIGYALGDAAAGGIAWKIMSIAFPLFFTNIFGLTFADTALLILIARIFDVVTDPLMGILADRTRTRWGVYRPWLIFGAIPFGIIFSLLLYTPDFDLTGRRIWAYTLYLLMMVVYTAVNVPYGSLLGVMTDDDNEKNQFSSYRMVGAYAMGFITLLTFPYIMEWIGGSAYTSLKELERNAELTIEQQQQLTQINQHIYSVVGVFFGAIAAIMTLACGLLTKERHVPTQSEKISFKLFANLFKNRPWIYLTLISLCTNLFGGFRYAVVAYMFEYCLGGNMTVSGLIINYTVFMMFGEVTCMMFGGLSPMVTRKIGSKKKALTTYILICFIGSVLFFFVPMDSKYIWVMIGIVILTSIGIGLYSPLLWSMYADVADYATNHIGTSSTGLIFSSGTMSQKFGSAISVSLVALLLGLVGFTSNTDNLGNVTVSIKDYESAANMIWLIFSLFPAAICLLMLFFIYKYTINK